MNKEKTESEETQKKTQMKCKHKPVALGLAIALLMAVFALGWFLSEKKSGNESDFNGIGEQMAEERILSIVNEGVEVEGITVENGMYKALLSFKGKESVAYISSDGEIFATQFFDIDEEMSKKNQKQQAANVEVPKTEKPSVEVFVMSYCPYGTQVQRGMLPVIETLGDAADIEFKFVNYAMHGEKEIEENTRQYCIAEEQPAKFMDYMTCFLGSDDAKACLATAKVSTSAVEKCASAADDEFAIDEKLNDKKTWKGNYPPFDVHETENSKYSVQGSPTIVVNGVTVESKRDPASLLKTVCKGFETQPGACSEELSTVTPSTQFGEDAGTDSGGSCN